MDVSPRPAPEDGANATDGPPTPEPDLPPGVDSLGTWLHDWLAGQLPDWPALDGVILLIHLGAVAAIALAVALATRLLILPILRRVIERTRMRWDDILVEGSLFPRLGGLAPAAAVYLGAVSLLDPWPVLREVGERVALLTMVLYALLAGFSLLDAGNALFERRKGSFHRPIKGYVSLIKIVASVLMGIIGFAILLDKDPALLITGLGAMTAVLMLIFKDTILSVVASVTLSSGDMVRKGDWITVPSSDADGDVVDIALHHVTVQNFDKTLVTVPTYKLMADSFVNWRGMKRAGGRRIKRAVAIDLGTVRFLERAEIDRFAEFKLLQDYIADKRAALDAANADLPGDTVTNARRLTNIGTFRAYVINYLRSLDSLHQVGLTFMVRQLAPGPHGLPIEIYVFTTTTEWPAYEAIQADIFDHILAIAPEFGLRVYQTPSGADLALLGGRLPAAGVDDQPAPDR